MRWLMVLMLAGCAARTPVASPPTGDGPPVVIISANTEWRVVKAVYPDAELASTPWGEWFERRLDVGGRATRVIFFHGGWGKVAAAGSAQYAIDRWDPSVLINLGTCGGFDGMIEKHAVVLVERTVIYDIKEAMGDSAEAIADYTVALDLSWLTGEPPTPVRRAVMVSGDRDLIPAEVPMLAKTYGAVAGDWESGAIAYAAARNRRRLLILRGVSDVVKASGSEAYGSMESFAREADVVMRGLLAVLPAWLARTGR